MSYEGGGRLLRQNRAPRVFYTPETSSPKPRTSRPSFGNNPGAVVNTSSGANNSGIQNGGNTTGPIAVLVMTPSTNGKLYQSPFYQPTTAPGFSVHQNNRALPPSSNTIGVGARGIDWITRISMALRCGIQSEIDWALKGLLDLSWRQPEVLNFSSNDGLLEILLGVLDKAPYLTDLKSLKEEENYLETDVEFDDRQKLLTALLVIRNLSLDPKNAQFLANSIQCVELVKRSFWLPFGVSRYTELKSYCLDIAESISFHLTPTTTEDPFFVGLLHVLKSASSDRGVIIPALRALSRFVIRDEANVLGQGMPHDLMVDILRYLTVDDEGLISAVLDFLYQYTAHADNVAKLLKGSLFESVVCTTHLIRLLSYGLEEPKLDYLRLPRTTKPGPPVLPESILNELLKLDEPDRATNWIRSSYINDPQGEVTQISLWKAYETQFESYSRQGKKLLPAVEFIKNVTSAFEDCQAMVVHLPDGTKKFIIKGMTPRDRAISPSDYKPGKPVVVKIEPPKGLLAANSKPQPRQSDFGVTATLVLQNIARTPMGKNLLQPSTSLMIRAAVLNPSIGTHMDALLDTLILPSSSATQQQQQHQQQ